jgi:hypothetical protein
VRIAGAANLPEAEFLQSLLREDGIPSLVRRSAGFDVPDYMAGGPRDVLVPFSAASAARESLRAADLDHTLASEEHRGPNPLLLLGVLLGVGLLGVVLIVVLDRLG